MDLKRVTSFFILAATTAFLSVAATPALADDCALLGGAINGSGECEISSAVARTGTFNLDETLRVTGAGRIDASNASHLGITLNICVAPATPSPTCDLILDTPAPLVTPPAIGGGQIEANDLVGNDAASPITIRVSRDVLMHNNSAILALNTVSGGRGGDITIAVGRNMTMNALATISVTGTGSSGNSPAGSVTLIVGNYPNAPGVGVFTMDPTSQILANSPAASAGPIAISAGLQMNINGLVQSQSGLSGVSNQPPGGGPITLTSACKLMVGDTGKVSSEGHDPGADLVHLEGCDVIIYGIVESTTSGGHVLPTNPPNHCNLDTAAHPPGTANFSYTACVEIWANNIVIDKTGTHKGEVNADGVRTDAGGAKRAWIDILAKRDITIIASTTGNYAVHANPDGATNQFGGLINVKSQIGKIVTTALVPGTVGLALQASAPAAGGEGGEIIVQAGGASPNGKIDFTADSIQAIGASSGGTPAGGHITVQSFNDTILGLAAGALNAAGGGIAGTVTLTSCVGDPATTYAGTVTGTRTNSGPGICGGGPTFPAVAHFLTGLNVSTFFTSRQALWDACMATPTTPSITTVASAGGPLGTVLTDQATLAGGNAPTGTITFVLYGPNDATCTTVAFTSNAIPVAGNGTYTSAPGFAPVAPGTYRWRAFYSGDVNNNPVSEACGAANESADITPTTPTIVTVASAGGLLGTVLTDQATLSGGTVPTGSITFVAYGPNDATCTTVAFTSNAIPVAGNGTYTSAPGFTPAVAGTYRWRAFYSGDANNAAVSGACGAANESADITPTTPTFSTQASASGPLGTVLTDQATLAGGTTPTGTITFVLYGPDDATCTTVAFTSNAIPVNGNGTYTSAPGFAPVAVGTYRWRAFYSGDANNAAVSGACGAANEEAAITQTRTVPELATVASAGGPLGTVLTDTATLAGGTAPTGNIIFRLYGPNDATCATAIFTSNAIPVNGNGNYTSAPGFAPTAPGTYRWRAFYSGDAGNNGVITVCNAPNESAEITKTTPTIVTVASAGGLLGTVLTDQATLSGGTAPTGTITFVLYGPNDATCTTAIFTSNLIPVAGNGTYTSAPGFAPVAVGTYRWRAFYSGDANNNAVSGACGAPNESADIGKTTPTIVTVASAGGPIGTVLTDQATLSGGTAPTGTITFVLYGPNDATCTTAVFTSNAIAVSGNGTYTSAPGFTPTLPGTYRWRAFYSGDANNNAVSAPCGAPNESADIGKTTPTIVTVASAGGPIGTVLTDQATLSGGTAPTGTITFVLYGPNDATCTTAVFTSNAIAVSGNGTYTSAPGFTPTLPGTYRWRAFYSGDANNNAVSAPCGAPNESADIGKTTPTIVTVASAGGPVGTVLTDQATLSGGAAPTGTITFVLYGPNDATCTTAVFTSNAIVVSGNGTYTSAPGFTPTLPGTYRWRAFYSGDANNNAVSAPCGAPNESADIGKTTPTIVTTASAGGPIGTVLTDQATLSGGAAPTGTITFVLYGPNDATCTTAVFTSNAIAVSGNGTYTSAPGFTPTLPGTYRWRAFYSGDANNNAVSAPCGAPNESADIGKTTPTIVTVASAGGPIGTVLTDQATLSGGAAPTGTITFVLYGPNDATCTTAVFTSNAIAVSGNGTYTSAPGFTPTLPGTYRWRAFYSGDANNAAVSAPCNAPNEIAEIAQTKTVPELATVASPGGLIGTVLTDTATLAGGTAPTGSIIFRLYGPNDATCATAIFTSNAIPVNGNGSYTSAPGFAPAAIGTYRWRAFYSGDAGNNGVITQCNAPNESADITSPPFVILPPTTLAEIPTLSWNALIALMLLVALVAPFYLRRARR